MASSSRFSPYAHISAIGALWITYTHKKLQIRIEATSRVDALMHKWTDHVYFLHRQPTLVLLKVYMTLSILKECPSAINTPGAVNMSLNSPSFAILPAVCPAGHPIENTLHLQESRWERGKDRKTRAIDINDLLATRGPKVWGSEGPLDTNWSW